ncbi:MAG: GNAT family N-acetyltransferase [Clostridia bacterium]|nr:GNAT family N-acetyltransferase [Clostridia bacterium]
MANITVRYVNENDEYVLNELLKINEEEGDFSFGWDYDSIREMALQDSQDYWIGEDIDAPSRNGDTALTLSDVYVIPDRRDNGVGTALVSKTLELCKNEYPESDIHIVLLDCELSDFYEKFGFDFGDDIEYGTLYRSPEKEIDNE